MFPASPSYTEQLVEQVLEDRGLAKYTDDAVLRAAEVEIGEAYDLSPQEMDTAAQSLIRKSSFNRPLAL